MYDLEDEERVYKTAWYAQKKEEEAVKALVATVRSISEEDNRLDEHSTYLKLYSGAPESARFGFYSANVDINNSRNKPDKSQKHRVNYNVIKSVIDTLVAKACLNPPKASLITEGGDIDDRLATQKLDKAIFISMKQGGVFKDWAQFVKQALVHGDCEVKVYACPKSKTVKYEKLLPPDIYVHSLDAMYGKPTCKYQTTYIRKDVLFSKYPKFKEAYLRIKPDSRLTSQFITRNKIEYQSNYEEYVELVEAWKIQQFEGDKGRHMIICKYGALLDEKFTEGDHIFAKLSWNKPHVGYFSEGIASQLRLKQRQINMILTFITEAASIAKSPKLVIKSNDLSGDPKITNNAMGEVIKLSGSSDVQWLNYSGYPPTEFERLQWLIRSCYEEVGLNQMSSTGKNILGSGASKVALQEFTDIESDRFQEFGKALDNFMIDLAQKTIIALRDLKEMGVKEVKGSYNGINQCIKLEKLNFDEAHDFVITTSSMLPMSTAARKDFASDLYNSGVIDSAKYLELLNMPDLEQYNKLKLAPRQAMEMQVEKLIETKDTIYTLPNENFDLQYGLQFVTALLCQYSIKDEDDAESAESIQLLEQLKGNITVKLNEIGALQQAMVQQAQLQQQQLTAAPIGKPAQVSVSTAGQ